MGVCACLCLWLSAALCWCSVIPAPYTLIVSSCISPCVCTSILELIRLWPMWIPSVSHELDLLRASCLCMHKRAFKIKHLTATRNCCLTLKAATYLSCAGTTKPHFLQSRVAESPPCSWWPLISPQLFLFRLWCDAVHAGGAALWGPWPGPRSCDQALHGVAFGLALWGPVWEQRTDL